VFGSLAVWLANLGTFLGGLLPVTNGVISTTAMVRWAGLGGIDEAGPGESPGYTSLEQATAPPTATPGTTLLLQTSTLERSRQAVSPSARTGQAN
jgi:hypothetical protein